MQISLKINAVGDFFSRVLEPVPVIVNINPKSAPPYAKEFDV